jgi:hypothetical protein
MRAMDHRSVSLRDECALVETKSERGEDEIGEAVRHRIELLVNGSRAPALRVLK